MNVLPPRWTQGIALTGRSKLRETQEDGRVELFPLLSTLRLLLLPPRQPGKLNPPAVGRSLLTFERRLR